MNSSTSSTDASALTSAQTLRTQRNSTAGKLQDSVRHISYYKAAAQTFLLDPTVLPSWHLGDSILRINSDEHLEKEFFETVRTKIAEFIKAYKKLKETVTAESLAHTKASQQASGIDPGQDSKNKNLTEGYEFLSEIVTELVDVATDAEESLNQLEKVMLSSSSSEDSFGKDFADNVRGKWP